MDTKLRFSLLISAVMYCTFCLADNAVKIQVCHIPPGDPSGYHTISVSENALPAHLAHGDLTGGCFENCEALCDDGNSCTQDIATGTEECICLEEPQPVNCDDGLICTDDYCDTTAGGCQNIAIDCSDANLCTLDVCNPSTGLCENPDKCVPEAACDPNVGTCIENPCSSDLDCGEANACVRPFCAEDGTCQEEVEDCGEDDPDDCRVTSCDPFLGCVSQTLENGTPCDEGNACTQGDFCRDGACVDVCAADEGNACFRPFCGDDGTCQDEVAECPDVDPNDCTITACDPFLGCVSQTLENGTPCDDGNACTAGDSCRDGACVDGCTGDGGDACFVPVCADNGTCQDFVVDCGEDDPNDCTAIGCDPFIGCVSSSLPDGSPCDDGNPDTEVDTCVNGACNGN